MKKPEIMDIVWKMTERGGERHSFEDITQLEIPAPVLCDLGQITFLCTCLISKMEIIIPIPQGNFKD